ncbi:MAG: GNAT family N-acetyltransferase [Solobacterium sp.]|nr:GNAT family N-acetyltransferase [Solobacterium sp.]
MIRLEKINSRNIDEVLRLRVQDDQKEYAADNRTSIIEAYIAVTNDGHAFTFAVCDGSRPVGFVMIGYDTDDCWEDPPAIAKGNYSLWRLMIGKEYQHRGYGRKALGLALEFIRSFPCGTAEYCWVSYLPENKAAKELYRSFGFEETGDSDGQETLAVLKLEKEN